MIELLKNNGFAPIFCGFAPARGKIKVEAQKSYPQAFRLKAYKKVA